MWGESMLGAVIGDIVGSLYAFEPIRTKKFPLFDVRAHYTDDTIFAAAVANVTRSYIESGKKLDYQAELKEEFLRLTWLYPDMAYSRFYSNWMFQDAPEPYGSAGITAASRAFPIGFLADSLEEAEELGKLSSEITHNHAEGIKGAQCVAGLTFLARGEKDKQKLREYVESRFYKMTFTIKEIQLGYKYNPTCPGGVPPAIKAFLEAADFEDAVRTAICIGGGDSLAAITGALAEAYYGVPEPLAAQAVLYLDDELRAALAE